MDDGQVQGLIGAGRFQGRRKGGVVLEPGIWMIHPPSGLPHSMPFRAGYLDQNVCLLYAGPAGLANHLLSNHSQFLLTSPSPGPTPLPLDLRPECPASIPTLRRANACEPASGRGSGRG